jgi:hypothetical protein
VHVLGKPYLIVDNTRYRPRLIRQRRRLRKNDPRYRKPTVRSTPSVLMTHDK